MLFIGHLILWLAPGFVVGYFALGKSVIHTIA